MVDSKQKELVDNMIYEVQLKHPDVKLLHLSEDEDEVWLTVSTPKDEDEEITVIELLAEKLTDILVDHGYYFRVLPTHSEE